MHFAKEVRRAAHHSGERRFRVRTAASKISDLSSHKVRRDRLSKHRPLTASVIATVNSQEHIVRRALHPDEEAFEPLKL
eukprot:6210785-Pleurochrysis_carterae.AAC.6